MAKSKSDQEAHGVKTNALLRGPESQDQDFEQLVQDLAVQNFDDWPNEAGFEGLTEVRGPVELKVKGHLPSWTAGTLFRTGPGQYNIDDTVSGPYHTTHWFDGFAHSHKFEIIPDPENPDGDVRVEYSSRRQAEKLIETIKQDGSRDRHITFSQRRDPCVGMMGKFMTVWRHGTVPHRDPDEDNSCVTVMVNVPGLGALKNGHQRSAESGHRSGVKTVWLTTDSNAIKEVDRDTLEPIGLAEQKDLHPSLRGPISCAHAHVDPDTGDVFNYNLDLGKTSTYRVFRVSATTGKTDILATIARPDVAPAYAHSFLLSRSFVIMCIASTHIGNMGLGVVWNRNLADAIEPFDESKRCKWIVVDRRHGRGVVGTFETAAGFFFHSVNAFDEDEDGGEDVSLFCDVLEYPTLDVIRSFELDVIRGTHTGKMGDEKHTRSGFWGNTATSRDSLPTLVRHKFVVRGYNHKPSTTTGSSSSKSLLGSLVPWPVSSAYAFAADTVRGVVPGGLATTSAGSHDWQWRAGEKLCAIRAPRVGELPTINPRFATRRYRYVYTLPNTGRTALLDSIAKTDLETRTSLFWDNPKGHTPGEAIFVPRPRGCSWGEGTRVGREKGKEEEEGDDNGGDDDDGREQDEDDGVLLSVVLDGFGKTSYLVCLDARTMREIGRAECDWAIGHGFHGMHASAVDVGGGGGVSS